MAPIIAIQSPAAMSIDLAYETVKQPVSSGRSMYSRQRSTQEHTDRSEQYIDTCLKCSPEKDHPHRQDFIVLF